MSVVSPGAAALAVNTNCDWTEAEVPSWFTAMDTSRDGVISAREFLGTAEMFAALDKNGNGFFEPSEIPVTETKAEVIEPTSAEPAEEKAP